MDVKTRNRTELKSYFVKNSIPKENEFADLIEGMLNQKDDGLVKLPGNPLSIEAAGADTGLKKVINFYRSFGDAKPDWTLNLNPRSKPADPGTAKLGFNISDGESNSRLFIDRSTGNIGIGTIQPSTPLTIRGNGGTYDVGITQKQVGGGATMELTTADGSGQQATRLLLRGANDVTDIEFYRGKRGEEEISLFIRGSDGNVGIGTIKPERKLDVKTSGGTGVEGVRMEHGGEGSAWGVGIMGTNDSNPGAFTIERFDSDNKYYTKFLIDNTDEGNVGIGPTKPSEKLDVNGRVKSGALTIGPWKANSNYVFFGTNSLDQTKNGNYALLQNSTGAGIGRTILNSPLDIRFRIKNGEKMILANNGDIGIGITNLPLNSKLYVKGSRVDIHSNQTRFTGIHHDARRAQVVLSSEYSDLVIASSQINNNHGSTLTFAAYNPANANDYHKWVINQGNWGTRKQFLEFGYRDNGNMKNPHSNISDAATVLTLDGINKRVGIGTRTPGAKLSFNNMNDSSNGADGITWFNSRPTEYGIHRTAGAWSSPNYQQLRLGWTTGIVLDPGTRYGKSYVDIQGGGLVLGGGTKLQRIIAGRVNSNGSKAAGSGFTSRRTAKGAYVITFSPAFSSAPIVVATCNDSNDDNTCNATASKTKSNIAMFDIDPNTNAVREDGSFSFIAIDVS